MQNDTAPSLHRLPAPETAREHAFLEKIGEGRLFLSMKLVQGVPWKKLLHPATPEEEAAAASYAIERNHPGRRAAAERFKNLSLEAAGL